MRTTTERRPGPRARTCAGARGFSLVEVQIAVVVMAITIFTLGGHHRVMNALLRGAHDDGRTAGYVDLTSERAFVMIADRGAGAGPPPCDVKVSSVSFAGSYPTVYVTVQEAPW